MDITAHFESSPSPITPCRRRYQDGTRPTFCNACEAGALAVGCLQQNARAFTAYQSDYRHADNDNNNDNDDMTWLYRLRLQLHSCKQHIDLVFDRRPRSIALTWPDGRDLYGQIGTAEPTDVRGPSLCIVRSSDLYFTAQFRWSAVAALLTLCTSITFTNCVLYSQKRRWQLPVHPL